MSYSVCRSFVALCLALVCLVTGVPSLLADSPDLGSPSENPYKTRVKEALVKSFDHSVAADGPILSLAQDQNEPWSSDYFVSGLDGPVIKVLEFEGDLIVAGGFETTGGTNVNHIARWDGSSWHKMGAGFNDWVTVLAFYQGQLIAGGDFTHSGGTEVNHVARWNGVSWEAIGGGVTEEVDANAWINSIIEFNDELYVGGNFSHAGEQPIAHIAKWDGKSWNAVGDGLNSDVQTLHIHGHELIAGGAFTKNEAGDQFLLSVARLFGDTWVPIGDGFNARVNDLGSFGGKLVATGDFTFTGTTLLKYLAEWDGQQWIEIGGGLGGPGWVLEDGEKEFGKDNFIVGGNFIHGALVWNGNILVTVTPVAPIRNIVLDVKPFGSSLVFGGLFLSPVSDDFRYIASLNNFAWQPLLGSVGLGFNGRIRDICEFRGDIYVVGDFTRAGGKPINHVARWDGAEWQPVGAGIGGSGHSLLVKDDVLYVGGAFEWAGQAIAVGIAQWDGETWLSVGPGFNGFVRTMIDFEGTLIAGGAFSMSGGRQVFGIAQWNGTIWLPLNRSLAGGSIVFDLEVFRGNLYVAGDYRSEDGEIQNYARWTGLHWTKLLDSIPPVGAIHVYNDELIVSGAYTIIDGVEAQSIASWDGNTYKPLGAGLDFGIFDLHTFKGDLIATGRFRRSDDTVVNNIARWNSARGTWLPLGGGLTWQPDPLSTEGATLFSKGDRLYVGGTFTLAGGKEANYFSTWDESLVPVEILSAQATRTRSGAELTWKAAGDPADVLGFHVYRGNRRISDSLIRSTSSTYRFEDLEAPREKTEYFLAGIDRQGETSWHGPVTLAAASITPVLGLANPNPFRASTTISLSLPERGNVSATVMDLRGRQIRILHKGFLEAGEASFTWNGLDDTGRPTAAGVYFLKISSRGQVADRKILKIE